MAIDRTGGRKDDTGRNASNKLDEVIDGTGRRDGTVRHRKSCGDELFTMDAVFCCPEKIVDTRWHRYTVPGTNRRYLRDHSAVLIASTADGLDYIRTAAMYIIIVGSIRGFASGAQ